MRTFFGVPLHRAIGISLMALGASNLLMIIHQQLPAIQANYSTNSFTQLNYALALIEFIAGYTIAIPNNYFERSYNEIHRRFTRYLNNDIPEDFAWDAINLFRDTIDGRDDRLNYVLRR